MQDEILTLEHTIDDSDVVGILSLLWDWGILPEEVTDLELRLLES